MTTFLFFCWIFLPLLTTKFSPAWTLFFFFFFCIQSTALQWFQSHPLRQLYQSASVSNSCLRHHHSSCTAHASGLSTGAHSLRPAHYASLSCIIANHSGNHQLFADDAQLQKSAPLSEVTSLAKELYACTDDMKTWMTENQLKLNDDKTEALSAFRLSWNLLPFPSLIQLFLALATSPSLILPGTVDSFLTQNRPWRSTS